MRPRPQESIEDILTRRARPDDADRLRAAVDLATERLTQWIDDGGMVHVDLLAELLEDMEEVLA